MENVHSGEFMSCIMVKLYLIAELSNFKVLL